MLLLKLPSGSLVEIILQLINGPSIKIMLRKEKEREREGRERGRERKREREKREIKRVGR